MVQRFTDWAQREKTLSAVARCIKNDRFISWRYWLRENNRVFHCGVMMVSCDRSQRPNLLILAGRGEAAGDADNWESYSMGCRKTWLAMSAVGREDFNNLQALQARLATLPRPEIRLSPVDLEEREAFQAVVRRFRQTIKTDKARCLTDKAVYIESADNSEEDLLWNQVACRQVMQMTPDGLFMGGLPGKTRLVFFFRQLYETDFIQFWE